ncbi:MAG TPA: hypothetical protein VLS87_10645 [Woeseiaceae bacterium]|nr:hypothetical protein [Woeseiaceae bacterium]
MHVTTPVLRVADVRFRKLTELLGRFGLSLELLDDGAPITGSYWGEPEAGVVGRRVYVRLDTPVHSLLHETCHVICMDGDRRAGLVRDAGGDDIEEAAVCYLQVVLADYLPGVGRDRLMQDMDSWGYSFRLGSSRAWFESDAGDARDWLLERGLLGAAGRPLFVLRK